MLNIKKISPLYIPILYIYTYPQIDVDGFDPHPDDMSKLWRLDSELNGLKSDEEG